MANNIETTQNKYVMHINTLTYLLTSRSSEVNFTKNYTLLYLYLLTYLLTSTLLLTPLQGAANWQIEWHDLTVSPCLFLKFCDNSYS